MIDIKKYNYITGNMTDVSYAVNRIIYFLEIEGNNALLLHSNRYIKSTNMKYLYSNKIEFSSFESFVEVISNTGNIFKVDILILDFWHLEVDQIMRYKIELDKLVDIKFVILARSFHYKKSDDINDFHIRSESNEFTFEPTEYVITDNISGWSSTISNLATSYIRDKKIEQIFNKDSDC